MAFPMKVAVVSSVRTAVGRALKGTLKNTRPETLAAAAMNGALKAAGDLDPKEVQDLVLGCAMPEAEQGLNIARNAVWVAKWPNEVPAETVNRFCSSGLQAIVHGAMQVQCGLSDVVVGGGVESMSHVPLGGNKVSLHPDLVDTYPESYIGMGHTAERVSKRFDVTREQQDTFAYNSQMKAKAALESGVFADEIVPVMARVFGKDGSTEVEFKVDELPRTNTTIEGLGKVRPAFAAKGSVTAGNSSPLSDGAAASVLMSEAALKKFGVKPIAYLRGFHAAGLDPDIMGIGPVPAIRGLLQKVGLTIEDIGLFEINEAFAAQAAYCQRELKIPDEKINVYGGAIALGHPLGCTGAKLSATLIHELKRRGAKYGVVSMCIGGGMGAAGLYELA